MKFMGSQKSKFAFAFGEGELTHSFVAATTGRGLLYPVSQQGKHYFSNGTWHPVVFDPMGEQDSKQWLAEQEQEKQALRAAGEPVND